MRIENSIEIAATAEKIWPFLIEPEKIMKWFTLLQKFEYTGDKKSGAGATFYYEEKSGPQLMKFNFKVTEWVENERLAFVMTSGPMKRDDEIWSIKAAPSGSTVTLTMDVEMPWGVIGKILDRLFAGSLVGKHQKEILANLKALLELPAK
ncbi:MAG: SRPBCC family protein [Dehalococcoidia bacterium]|nr:MAG: SRPBCC family protein [Dehalococcoidia bacterium]